jgi:hypothetical protein
MAVRCLPAAAPPRRTRCADRAPHVWFVSAILRGIAEFEARLQELERQIDEVRTRALEAERSGGPPAVCVAFFMELGPPPGWDHLVHFGQEPFRRVTWLLRAPGDWQTSAAQPWRPLA